MREQDVMERASVVGESSWGRVPLKTVSTAQSQPIYLGIVSTMTEYGYDERIGNKCRIHEILSYRLQGE
jgi:hypothetical protein